MSTAKVAVGQWRYRANTKPETEYSLGQADVHTLMLTTFSSFYPQYL